MNSAQSDLLDFGEVDQFIRMRGNSIQSERSDLDDKLLDRESDKSTWVSELINEMIDKVAK